MIDINHFGRLLPHRPAKVVVAVDLSTCEEIEGEPGRYELAWSSCREPPVLSGPSSPAWSLLQDEWSGTVISSQHSASWYPCPDSNRGTRFRKPVLYPPELQGHMDYERVRPLGATT